MSEWTIKTEPWVHIGEEIWVNVAKVVAVQPWERTEGRKGIMVHTVEGTFRGTGLTVREWIDFLEKRNVQ